MKIKYGIIGLGRISHKFYNEIKNSPNSICYGVGARDKNKAILYHSEDDIPLRGDYSLLANSKEIDAIYIATINSEHYKNIKYFLEHGKHVIVEKPITLIYDETADLIKIAKEKNLLLMEGMWSIFNPSIVSLLELVSSNKYGEIVSIKGDYDCSFKEDHRVLIYEGGGGTLLDIGCYLIALTYHLKGMPSEIVAKGRIEDRVDIETSIVLSYPDNVVARLHTHGKSNNPHSIFEITLDKAIITLDKFNNTDSYKIVTFDGNEEVVTLDAPSFSYQITHFSNLIINHKLESNIISHKTMLATMKIIDIVEKQIGLDYSDLTSI
jgi:predicted dehydrogenase